jgi:hypothetical protein
MESMWKEVIVAYFQLIALNLREDAEGLENQSGY